MSDEPTTEAAAVAALLDALWRDYVASTPQAARIQALFAARGERVQNDHVALRTYGAPAVGLEVLARPFEALGWRAVDDYRFKRRMPSRAAAVRDLLRLGLGAVGIEPATGGMKSNTFGVLERGDDGEAVAGKSSAKPNGK